MTKEEKIFRRKRGRLYRKIIPLIAKNIRQEHRTNFFKHGFLPAEWLSPIFSANLKKEEFDEITTLMDIVNDYQAIAPVKPKSAEPRSRKRSLDTPDHQPRRNHPWRHSSF